MEGEAKGARDEQYSTSTLAHGTASVSISAAFVQIEAAVVNFGKVFTYSTRAHCTQLQAFYPACDSAKVYHHPSSQRQICQPIENLEVDTKGQLTLWK